MARLIRSAVLIYGVWTAAALFFTSQHALISWARGWEIGAGDQLATMLLGCTIWALFTPFVIYVAERLPLDVDRRAKDGDDQRERNQQRGVAHRVRRRAQVQIHLLFVLRREEQRFAAALAQARLRRLRADLNPHFLFNALNAAASLLETNPAAAERTIDTLCDLLGRSVATENALEVKLADELEFIERYLEVQKTRYGPRLRTEISVASDDLLDAAIPPLLIQPLVENAIVHSVALRPEGGWVGLRVARDGERLNIEVHDDGEGFDPATLRAHDSIGVPNARARLQFLYGDDQSLTFLRRDHRFIAQVQLPLHQLEAAA